MGTLLCSLFSLALSSSAQTPMQAYVSAMQPGWNLGNTLDAIPGETSWGNRPATQALIRQIAAQGFKSIRIPVTWADHMGAAPGYAVDPVWMDRVQQVVDWSLEAGMYVMLNVHHDSWLWMDDMPTQHDVVRARFRALWVQIAERFRNHPNMLMFESINEPNFEHADDATRMALLDELNTLFFHLVRESGGGNATRPLVLPTVVTNAGQPFLDSLNSTISRLDDRNLITTVHFYGFWPFSVNIAGCIRFEAATIADIVTQMDAVHETFVARGIPAVVGEYGLIAFDKNVEAVEHGEMLKFFEYFTTYARSKDITHMWWDNGQHFDRKTFQWRDPDIHDIIMQSLEGRSSTAEAGLIFLRRGAAVEDVAVKLDLNGNRFVSLQNGSTFLRPGDDYAVDGNVLTVKASSLCDYASGSYGQKTVLAANFDAGPAWKMFVRCFNTPVQRSASATKTRGLVIPTAFNGDRIASMEAVYVGGGNAGPNDWTPYKEYADAYLPNYAKNTITITPKFFSKTNGEAINLTFHFWSGETLRYQVVTKGKRVTGKPL